MNYGQEATTFLLIFTVWSLSLYIRVYDEKLKKYTAAMVFCIIFWMILRLIRHFAPSQLSVYMWYLYYIPLLFILTFYYNCSDYLQNRNNDKGRHSAIVASACLVLFVLTNNLHSKKIFEKSHLPLEVISSDGEKRFQTNHKIEVVEKIKKYIVNKQVKEKYQKKTKVQNAKTIYGGYVIEEKDFSKIKK